MQMKDAVHHLMMNVAVVVAVIVMVAVKGMAVVRVTIAETVVPRLQIVIVIARR